VTLKSLRVAVLGAAAAGLVGGLVACSSGTAPAEPTSAAPAAQTTAAQTPSGDTASGHEAFMQCMTENGVPAPPEGEGHRGGPPPEGAPPHDNADGGTPPAPPGVDQDTWDKAMQSCSSLAPAPPH
jgi:hypothetical protein